MTQSNEYGVRDFSGVRGLKGIPDGLVEAHLKLYAGYVKNINLLKERLRAFKAGAPEFSELHRRVGFEINGMRLHELYFDNLSPAGGKPSGAIRDAVATHWGSFELWQAEFAGIGLMRGVGWAILYRDPVDGRLSNHWIGLHEEGHPAGFQPILVMDLWEHAFTGLERPKYVDAFLSNAHWEVAEARLSASVRAAGR
jgi:Fe-Mn family superoxide dismutase